MLLTQPVRWPLWRKFLFCFAFIFIALQAAPWTWFDAVPGVPYVTKWYYSLNDWGVGVANDHLFHVSKVLVPVGGSGDTSYGWAQLYLYLLAAAAGGLLWSVLDRKRPNYVQLNYWLCLFTRYYLAFIAFLYGFDKIFAVQMSPPSLSQMATPLGDFTPMRMAWLFIGYSTPYQVFSGIMEVTVGILLMYRRTATFGTMLAMGVFTNVMMLNYSYDIDVKIFSATLVLLSLFLVLNEWSRVAQFFILNKATEPSAVYHYRYNHRRMRIGRWVIKGVFLLLIAMQLYSAFGVYQSSVEESVYLPFKKGMYNVQLFALNRDTLSLSGANAASWKDMIFEDNGLGSIQTGDTTLRQRYGRVYFSFLADSLTHVLRLKKRGDTVATFHYGLPDANTVQLTGVKGRDSIHVVLTRSEKTFMLAKHPFHWETDSIP